MAGPAGVADSHLGGSNAPIVDLDGDDGVNQDIPSPPDQGDELSLGSPIADCLDGKDGAGESSSAGVPDGWEDSQGPGRGHEGPHAADDQLTDLVETLQLGIEETTHPVSSYLDTAGAAPTESVVVSQTMTPSQATRLDYETEPLIAIPDPMDAGVHQGEAPHVPEPDATSASVESSSGSSRNKGKQKQKVVHFKPLKPDHTALSDTNAQAGPSSEPPSGTDVKPSDLGWESSAERPVAKLPIRLLDAVGRTYVFPWEKAKTWEGMTRLVSACFIHVDVIGTHVIAGHYDLVAENGINFSSSTDSEPTTSGASSSSPSANAPPLAPSPPNNHNPNYVPSSPLSSSSSSSSSDSILSEAQPIIPGPVKKVNMFSIIRRHPLKAPIILPELWEDFVVPGMLIRMQMWPMGPFANHGPPHHHHHPPPPLPQSGPPPPPHLLPPMAPGGRGRGRGTFIVPVRRMVPPPPLRPKTRKRPE